MKKAVMYGAGNIGRGFIGQLFCLSGYETAFIDINETVINRLNRDHQYPVFITKGDDYEQFTVTKVSGVQGNDIDAVARQIAGASIMATAVGVNVLPHIAKPLAAGIKRRRENKNPFPLNIIVCENKLHADHYLAELVREHLEDQDLAYFETHVGFVEASIGRMVPATPKELTEQNPLSVCVEEYCMLPVDKAAFKGEIPSLCHMLPFTPFDFYIERKLYMHNMSHAATAYLGWLKGVDTIWQSSDCADIRLIVFSALLSSAQALSLKHSVPLSELIAHAQELQRRFENRLLGDTVVRVGKDPIRKLSDKDRLVGAAKLCTAYNISPAYICIGIAAGFLFSPSGDPAAAEVSSYAAEKGILSALEKYAGVKREEKIALYVNRFYDLLKQKIPLIELVKEAESL